MPRHAARRARRVALAADRSVRAVAPLAALDFSRPLSSWLVSSQHAVTSFALTSPKHKSITEEPQLSFRVVSHSPTVLSLSLVWCGHPIGMPMPLCSVFTACAESRKQSAAPRSGSASPRTALKRETREQTTSNLPRRRISERRFGPTRVRLLLNAPAVCRAPPRFAAAFIAANM